MRLLLLYLFLNFLLAPAEAKRVEIPGSSNTTVKTRFQVSEKLHGDVTKVSGKVSANVTDIEVSPALVQLKEAEEERLKVAAAALGIVLSILAMWGVIKNLLVSMQTLGREGFTLKFFSQIIAAVILLAVFMYSLRILIAGLGVVNLTHVF